MDSRFAPLRRPRHAGLPPLIGLPLGGLGVTINAIVHDGDLRVGVMSWSMAVALLSLARCALSVVVVHRPNRARRVRIGGWWKSALVVCRMVAFFVTIAIGTAVDIEGDQGAPGSDHWSASRSAHLRGSASGVLAA